ncbi:MAG: hypothetical protein WAS36_00970, partial [Candidatus Saccharimonadales bacterium]
ELLHRVGMFSHRNIHKPYYLRLLESGEGSKLGIAIQELLNEPMDDSGIISSPSGPYLKLEGEQLTFGLSFDEDEIISDAFKRLCFGLIKRKSGSIVLDTTPHLVLGVITGANPSVELVARDVLNERQEEYTGLALNLSHTWVVGGIFEPKRTDINRPGSA